MERGNFIKGLLFGGVATAISSPRSEKESLTFDIIQEPIRHENGRIVKTFKFEMDPIFRKALENKYRNR